MVSGGSLLVLIAITILFVVVASSVAKIHPFLALLLAALGLGFCVFKPVGQVLDTMGKVFRNITAGIGVMIAFGMIIRVALEESGAAIRIARSLLSLFGSKRIVWAMSCIGGLVGIP